VNVECEMMYNDRCNEATLILHDVVSLFRKLPSDGHPKV
jgi:hypothetical protein